MSIDTKALQEQYEAAKYDADPSLWLKIPELLKAIEEAKDILQDLLSTSWEVSNPDDPDEPFYDLTTNFDGLNRIRRFLGYPEVERDE